MDTIIGTIIPYLLKGGLLTGITYFLGDIKRFVKSAMWQSIIQAAVLGFILFLLDRFLPTPGISSTPTEAVSDISSSNDQGLLGNQGLGLGNLLGNLVNQGQNQGQGQGLLNNLTNFLQQNQMQGLGKQPQIGGDCGCGAGASMNAQIGGECGVSANTGSVPVGCF